MKTEPDVSARRALILALGTYPPERVESLVPDLEAAYCSDPDPGVHSAAAWTLRQIRGNERTDALARTPGPPAGQKWYVNEVGLTFSVLKRPSYLRKERGLRLPSLPSRGRHDRGNGGPVPEFKLEQGAKGCPPETDQPVVEVNWFDTAAYCNWLSARRGCPGTSGVMPRATRADSSRSPATRADRLSASDRLRVGVLCQAGATTTWHFGRADAELINRYGWWQGTHENGERRAFPVGSLKPNDWGLFDLHGNVSEWCLESVDRKAQSSSAVNRFTMAAVSGTPTPDAIDTRRFTRPDTGPDDPGFRVVRGRRRSGVRFAGANGKLEKMDKTGKVS